MITVFGSINLDLIARVERLPGPGQTVLGDAILMSPGGKGANQALAARRAGATVRLVGSVGDDAFAAPALALLAADGVDLSGVAHRPGATGVAMIAVDARGENQIVVGPGANRLTDAAQLEQAGDLLIMQMEVPVEANLEAARRAKAAGARVWLNLAPVGGLPEAIWPLLDGVVVNEHELGALGGSPEEVAERRQLAVVLTLGAAGAYGATPTERWHVPTPSVKVVDSTGAGDATVGALGAALDEGLGLGDALARAVVAGSLACTKPGAQPSLPTRAEILALMEGR